MKNKGRTEEEPRTLELRLDDWTLGGRLDNLVFRSARRRTLGQNSEEREEKVKMVKLESLKLES